MYERYLMHPLDAQARTLVMNSAKRVSIVTAVSPRALIDIGYVLYENVKLIRGLANLYGGRPGKLGFWRLIRNVVAQIGDKWSLLILFALVDGADRFNSLKSRIVGISQRMLTQTLRDLERDGYVNRTVFPEVPVRVEYELTEMGKGLVKPLYKLVSWAEENQKRIDEARRDYDDKNSNS